jgi:hypothetical protein
MAWRQWLPRGLLGVCLLAPAVRGDERSLFPFSMRARPEKSAASVPAIPVEAIAPGVRERVQSVLERPAFSAKSQPETFQAEGEVYRWLLDHPDVTVKLWRQVGAKVSEIQVGGDGVFVWRDDSQSEVSWHTVLRLPGLHVWYAEGKVKPAALLPLTNFRAVAVMSYQEGKDTAGKEALRHQVHFLLRCDSKAVSLAARILGASAPRLADQYLGQLQMFYGGMAWYLGQDKDRAKKMYRAIGLAVVE